MRKLALVLALLITASIADAGINKLIFMAGLSRQNPTGAIKLKYGTSLRCGVGFEAVPNFYIMLQGDIPAAFKTDSYPTKIDINGADSTFYFDKFTSYSIKLTGHYTLPIFKDSRFSPKIYGGLGLYWMYNSKESNQMGNVDFFGLGPEFGLGFYIEAHKNLLLDFSFSVKMATYNEYRLAGEPTSAIGIDEQFVCFNLIAFYLLDVPW